jgi:protein AFG1
MVSPSIVALKASPRTLSVYSRPLTIPKASGRTCRFTFAELCEAPLGPADYISLASTFDTFYIDEVPVLLLKAKNEARRLINLVDALCKSIPFALMTDESRCQVFIRADALPEDLFFPDAITSVADSDQILAEGLSETLHAPARPNVSVYNYSPAQAAETAGEVADANKAKVGAFSVLSIFTGEDERFAYVSTRQMGLIRNAPFRDS